MTQTRLRSQFKTSLRCCIALFVVALFLIPVFWFAFTSIKPLWATFDKDGVVWFNFAPTIENFRTVWFGPSVFSIRDSMLSSIVIALGSTGLALVLSCYSVTATSYMQQLL